MIVYPSFLLPAACGDPVSRGLAFKSASGRVGAAKYEL